MATWKQKCEITSVEELMKNNLGVKDTQDIQDWIDKSREDRYSLVGLKKASVLVMQFKKSPIYIIGDYDDDGKFATALIFLTLKRLGFTKVRYRIPRRFSEGYGLSENIIEEIRDDDSLVITVDNGIAAIEAVALAKSRGITVIVTDHHLPKKDDAGNVILPEADIIIDPNAIEGSSDFSGYCGAGIAYKLCKMLLKDQYPEFQKYLQTYAAVATVADSVPLREENWALVKKGMALLSKKETFPGIRSLLSCLGASDVDAEFIGYKIGPAINADTRLYDLETTAVDLLVCDNEEKAEEYAQKLIKLNEQRKTLVKDGIAFAEKVISHYKMESDFPLILNLGNRVPIGVIGIIAGSLAEDYRVPAIVFAESEEGILKGSGRTYDGINLFEIVRTGESLLQRFGGHAAAVGLEIQKANLLDFKKLLQKKCSSMERPDPIYLYDLAIQASECEKVLSYIKNFEPFGVGNPEPIFRIDGFKLKNASSLSTGGLKLTSTDGVDAVLFSQYKMSDECSLIGKKISIIGSLTYNVFRGERKVQVRLKDILL